MSQVTPPNEIQERLRKRFLDRLSDKIKKMRRDLVERNWSALKQECKHLALSGDQFGFPDISKQAIQTSQLIPDGEISRAKNLPEAKASLDLLLNHLDTLLVDHLH